MVQKGVIMHKHPRQKRQGVLLVLYAPNPQWGQAGFRFSAQDRHFQSTCLPFGLPSALWVQGQQGNYIHSQKTKVEISGKYTQYISDGGTAITREEPYPPNDFWLKNLDFIAHAEKQYWPLFENRISGKASLSHWFGMCGPKLSTKTVLSRPMISPRLIDSSSPAVFTQHSFCVNNFTWEKLMRRLIHW